MDRQDRAKKALPPYDSLTLMAVSVELREHLIGGQIQDIRQPEASDIQLGIRSYGKNFMLHLSAHPRFARVHLTDTRLPNTSSPPAFCMSLRKYVENGVIRFIRQIDFDRIFELVVERIDETGVSQEFRIIAELMGKHSNIVLVSANGTVLEACHRINSKINRFRETLPGQPYVAPPSQEDRIDPFQRESAMRKLDSLTLESPAAVKEDLLNLYKGFSPFLAAELAERIFSEGVTANAASRLQHIAEEWHEIFGAAQKGNFHPTIFYDDSGQQLAAYPFPSVQISSNLQKEAVSLNFALDDIYKRRIAFSDVQSLLTDIQTRLGRQQNRVLKSAESIHKSIEESEKSEFYRQNGELILANIWQIMPESKQLVVQDYFNTDFAERIIDLDAVLSPQENAELYFKRYRKAKDRGEMAREMLVSSLEEQNEVDKAVQELEALKSTTEITSEQITAFRKRLQDSGMLTEDIQTGSGRASAESSPFEGHKIRRTRIAGFEVIVGETSTANDYLTTRVASANDIWLHVRAATSAHVIIRTKGSLLVPHSVILEAAKICARHSGQKHSSLITVDYTLKKYVRKPRGAKPGSVDYQREKSLEISLED